MLALRYSIAVGFALTANGLLAEDVFRQQQDVVFSQVHGIAVTMDIFTPVGPSNGLGIVDVASGGWSSDRGKIRDHKRAQMYDIFCGRGYTVFAVRPGSLSRFSGMDMVDHVERSIVWIKDRSEKFSVDPNRLGLTGASAGGHLASLVAVRNGCKPDRKSASIAAAGVFFPPTDFLNYGGRRIDPRDEEGVGRLARALAFPDGVNGLGEAELEVGLKSVSSAHLVTAKAPPFLLIHGDADKVVPLQQSKRLMEELEKHDVAVELIVKEGGGHPWLTIPNEVAKLADWFDQQLLDD